MRIRTYPAVGFFVILVAAAFLGLAPSTIPTPAQSDKVLHFITFFLLTLCFYWILETNRRRNLQLTVFTCPFVLGIGSEIIQGLLPNGREFDLYDILANVLGSVAAILLCMWYHKRMLERKRQARYAGLPDGEGADDEDVDLELGEGVGSSDDGAAAVQSLEEEVDNWDENDVDWEEEGMGEEGQTAAAKGDEAKDGS